MKQIRLLQNITGLQIELSVVHFFGEEENFATVPELIFVAQGMLSVLTQTGTHPEGQEDIFLLNTGEKYSAFSDECVIVSLKLDPSLFLEHDDIIFDCNSGGSPAKEKYYNLKHLLARLVKISADTAQRPEYLTRSMLNLLIHELCTNFKGEKKNSLQSKKYLERLDLLTGYINENFRDNLSLSDVAEYAHLSVPYLSTFFDKYFGMSFLTYYTNVRLHHAVAQLMSSDESIEKIALDNGFSDPRAFVSAFRKKYGTPPSIYRKKNSSFPQEGAGQERQEDLNSNYLYTLAKYLPPLNSPKSENSFPVSQNFSEEKIDLSGSTSSEKEYLTHNFRKMTSIGRAKELLYDDVREMLEEWQKEMKFEYIKFHGILSDDMLFYSEDKDGNPVYSFVMIDKVLDYLLTIGLKPIIQFSFMPGQLALHPENSVFFHPMIISPPKSYEKWDAMIAALMNHWIERYTHKEVRSWLFCVWNEPDTAPTMFGLDPEDFYQLYQHTYKVVKSFGKGFRFGSTSLCIVFNVPKDFIRNYLDFAIRTDCPPDFLNLHFYDNDFTFFDSEFSRPDSLTYSQLNMDENSFSKTIDQIELLKKEFNLNIPVYLTEWNLTVSHRNLLNDTCFKSCYLVKNLLENYDRLDSFAYWVLTDLIEETQPSNMIFHGGLGLYTYNGIKKPHWYALQLLTKLGGTFIKKGNGFFMTKSYGKIQIVLYNYEHFNHLFASGETFDMTYTERYTPFPQLGKKDLSIELTNIPAEKCTIKEHIINQEYGSAFDKWLEMGACDLDKEDIEYLKSASAPKIVKYNMDSNDNTLKLSFMLSPLEVRLIEIFLK